MAIGRWISTAVTKSISLPNLRVLRDFVVGKVFFEKEREAREVHGHEVYFLEAGFKLAPKSPLRELRVLRG